MITQNTRDLPNTRDDPIGEEAAGLLLHFVASRGASEEADPYEDDSLCRWSEQSPEHRRVLRETVDTYRRLTQVDIAGLVDMNELLARARSDVQAETVRAQTDTRPLLAVAAAVLVALGALLVSDQRSTSPAYYSTHVGERETVVLPDGSTMTLNTNSKVAVTLGAHTREVRLISGQALFNVKHEYGRSFRVVSDNVTVEDLGTQFNVYKREQRSTVSVIAGRVRLYCECALNDSRNAAAPLNAAQNHRSLVLGAGEQGEAITGENGIVLNAQRLNPQQLQSATAWQVGVLDLTGMTLTDAVAELNRYTTRKLVVSDPSIAQMTMGGTLSPNVDDFLAAIKDAYEVEAIPSDASNLDSNPIHLRKIPTKAR